MSGITPFPRSTPTAGGLHKINGLTVALVLLTVTGAALGLRTLHWGDSLTVDEAWAVSVISADDFWEAARRDVHPPAYYLLLRGVREFSPDASSLRLTSLIFGVALPVFAVFCLRRLPLAALLCGLALATLPDFVTYSAVLRPYAMLLIIFAIALALAVRIYLKPAEVPPRLGLGLLLSLAATAHLITVFFLLILAPLLLWPVRQAGVRAWFVALLPLIPATLTALALKAVFITPPATLGGGWWMKSDPASTLAALRDVMGGGEILWLADAWSRHAPGGTMPVILLTGLCALSAVGTAWGRRPADSLDLLLPTGAALYLAAAFTYSFFFEDVIMPRTLLPALLPLLAGLACGIATHPVRGLRVLASGAVVLYLLMVGVPQIRRAGVAEPGLREFAAIIASKTRPGDLLVRFRAIDYSLTAYRSPPAEVQCFDFDQTLPAGPQLEALAKRLAQLVPDQRVFFAYREDHYHHRFTDTFSAAVDTVARYRPVPAEIYRTRELVLLATPAHDSGTPAR